MLILFEITFCLKWKYGENKLPNYNCNPSLISIVRLGNSETNVSFELLVFIKL